MTDIPKMEETDEPLEDARKYLVDYTEHLVNLPPDDKHWLGCTNEPQSVLINWRDYEVLSLTIQDLLEHVQKLTNRVKELENKN